MRKTTTWRQVFGVASALTVLAASCAYAGPLLEGTGSQPFIEDKPSEAWTIQQAAIESLRVSAEKGQLTDDMLDYGSVLEFGTGPAGVDLKGAFDLYEKAADRGNVIARRRMCIAYLLGQGRSLNRQKAYSDYCGKLKATDSAFIFGGAYDYELGLSGEKDEEKALNLYIQAFQQGSPDAMDAIGRILLAKGKSKSAITFLRQAIFHGSADAMDRMAGLLETGTHVEADPDAAWWLYVNAARRGNEHARQRLKALPEHPLLNRAIVYDKAVSQITLSETDKAGVSTTKPFLPMEAGHEVFRRMPREIFAGAVEGSVDLHCYINKRHVFDICMIQSELPIGYGYGAHLRSLYSEHLSVPEQDIKGQPTAGAVFAVTYRWIFAGPKSNQ